MLPLADAIAGHVDVRWLLAGLVAHVGSHAVRSRGWFNVLRASYPQAQGLRARDVMAASFAGSGLNSVVPARGGDLVKLAFMRRRIRGACYRTLIATAVPETAFETLCGAALVAWMMARGLLSVPHVSPALVAVPAAGVCVALALRVSRRRETMPLGFAIFSDPLRFLAQVASWQALARVIRLGSLACFLAAFGLPATLGTALLVMGAEGGGRVLPLGPVSTGLRIAILSCGFAEIAGQPVDTTALAAFTVGTGAALFVITFAIAAVLIVRELGTCSPRLAIRRARVRLQARPVSVRDA
jgi:hypothetical protein